MSASPLFRSAAAIAADFDCSAKTIHRRARAEGWQSRSIGNRMEYRVPRGIRKAPTPTFAPVALEVWPDSFITLEQRASIWRTSWRFSAVDALNAEILQGMAKERALVNVAKAFHTSPASLRRWDEAITAKGIAGLLEDKLGKVGRKPAKVKR